jgi:hypothetical protein
LKTLAFGRLRCVFAWDDFGAAAGSTVAAVVGVVSMLRSAVSARSMAVF